MSPTRIPEPRRLVLGRETVRALSEPRPREAATLQPQEYSSCFPDCMTACRA